MSQALLSDAANTIKHNKVFKVALIVGAGLLTIYIAGKVFKVLSIAIGEMKGFRESVRK